MAQPTQQFPPWLSPSPFTVTDAAGTPVTETSIIYVAPTYFGPSIPLGSLYSFGGFSEPPTVILPMPSSQTVPTTAPPSTATPITTSPTTIATPTSVSSTVTNTSATPSTTVLSSSSATPSSSSSTVLSSSSITTTPNSMTSTSTSSFAPSATSSSQPMGPAEMAGLTKGQLVGVIVASILGLIFIFVLALFLYLWCRGRRNRRNYSTFSHGIDDDYYFVPSGAGRVPGEGSPRHSGEEQDPFLQRSRSGVAAEGSTTVQTEAAAFAAAATAAATAGTSGDSPAMTQVSNGKPATRQPVSRVPPPTTGSGSSASTGSHASGFGVLLERPSLGIQLPSTEEEGFGGAGRPLSESDMRRIGHESVLPVDYDEYPDEEYTGAYAYSQDPAFAPRLVGATAPLLGDDGDREYVPTPSPTRDLVHQPSLEESATLLTARRVKVEDLGPRTTSQNPSPVSAGQSSQSGEGLLGVLGLGGLSNRLSWFNRSSSRHSHSQDFTIEPFLEKEQEKDLESGQGMLSPADARRQVDSFGNRARGVGPDGTRPESGLSARSGTSGGTMYHDAHSSIPGTPLLAAPPRALTPADMGHEYASNMPNEQTWLSSSLGPSVQYTPANSPPGYEAPLGASSTTSPMQSPTGTSFDHSLHTDILDMPAPTALGHFASISSLKETPTGSSAGGYKVAPFPPPGLETVRPIGWQHAVGANVMPVGPYGAGLSMDEAASEPEHGAGISIDVLEEAPPDAQQGWRRMAGPTFVNRPDRGTFGTFVEGFGFGSIMSEHASLHSMRSHLTPSSRSTGSAAASRPEFNGSISSANSGRPSAHSSAFSAVAHSLVRQGSLTNDSRHRGVSPALSAFGPQMRHGSPSVDVIQDEPLAPVIGAPPSAHMSPPGKASPLTHRSAGSDATAVMGSSSETVHGLQPARSLSPLSSTFPLNAPWAGGLDNDWQPTA